jgi:hypothetical protein
MIAANKAELATGANPFRARLAGVTQPAHQMGAAPGTEQVAQAARVAARQNPGQTIARQVANYAQGQRYLRPFQALGYASPYQSSSRRYDPSTQDTIRYYRDPRTGQLIEE